MRKIRRDFDRKVLVRQLVATGVEFQLCVFHAKVRDKGLLISCCGLVFSYFLEFYEGKWDAAGNFYLRYHASEDWELVYDGFWFYPHNGLSKEKGKNIRFKGEYPPFDRSLSLGRHVITFVCFNEDGLDVLHTLGRDRTAMLRCLDENRGNFAYDNFEVQWYRTKPEALALRLEYLARKKHRLRRR